MEKPITRQAHLIANTKSGKGDGANLPELAKRIAQQHGFELTHYPTEDPAAFEKQIDAAASAAQKDGGILIGAGGDGTIRAVAEKAAESKVPFAAVPCGTFNFFARNHKVPEEIEKALELAFTGQPREVGLGKISGHYFLINASLGLYAKSIRDREKSTKRFGRDRLVVILSTMLSLLGLHRRLRVELVTKERTQQLETMSIFIGNNALQLRDLALDVAKCMKSGLLAAVILKPVGRLEMLRILWRGIAKTLENEERLETFCVDTLTVHLPQPSIMVALDGEMFRMSSPLRIQSIPKALTMILPAPSAVQ